MSIGAIQTAAASLHQIMDRMELNAHDIASVVVEKNPNGNPDLPNTAQVTPSPQTWNVDNNLKGSTNTHLIDDLVDNLALLRSAQAQIKTIKTADQMLGAALELGK